MWNMYFDESAHDFRNSAKGVLGNYYLDSYIGVYLGIPELAEPDVFDQYKVFETSYKKVFKVGKELKGTDIRNINENGRNGRLLDSIRYGIASFDNDVVAFYSDFFDIVGKIDFVHIVMLSKFEQNIESLINFDKFYGLLKEKFQPKMALKLSEAYLYSLTKFLYVYRNNNLQATIYDKTLDNDKKIIELKKFMSHILHKDDKVSRKEVEKSVIPTLSFFINKDLWTNNLDNRLYYNDALCGIDNLLKQERLYSSNIKMYPDNGTGIDFSKFNFSEFKELESAQSVGIRIADMLSNFLYKILLAYEHDTAENFGTVESSSQFHKLKIISKNWFDLSKKQFDLYIKISNLIIKLKEKNCITTGIYFDEAEQLYTVFAYFGQFSSYQEYSNYSLDNHKTKFHECEMQGLISVYESKGW